MNFSNFLHEARNIALKNSKSLLNERLIFKIKGEMIQIHYFSLLFPNISNGAPKGESVMALLDTFKA